MKKYFWFFFLLNLLIIPQSSIAQDTITQGTGIDIGLGAITCNKYASRSFDKKNDFVIWTQGFFSAFNALDPDTKNIAVEGDYRSIVKWLDDYCRANPQQYFGEAVRSLIDERYPRRVPAAPSNANSKDAAAVIHFKN
jgi:hypothetical protein